MKKRLILLCLFLILLCPTNIFAEKALPNNSSKMDIVSQDGSISNYTFSTYIIDDYNYFKLRNFASYMNNTAKKFDIKFNSERNAIEIFRESAYRDFSGLPKENISASKKAIPSPQKIFIDGREVQISGYNIEGNNYFKLRDLAEALDIKINYDEVKKCVILNPNLSNDEKILNELNQKMKVSMNLENPLDPEIKNIGSGEINGKDNDFIYFPPKNKDRKINLRPGYAAEIKNSRITNFRKINSSINIPKNTGLLYIDFDSFKNKTIYIDGNDVNISQNYINKWMKNNILLPFITCERNGQNDSYKVIYLNFVNTAPKKNEISELVNAKGNELTNIIYGNEENLIDFPADKGQMYSLAKKGEDLGLSWWSITKPTTYKEKIEHMINYALSMQGATYQEYDCSGLVGTAADYAGFEISPAYSWLIEGSPNVYEVPMNELRRGDLLNKAGEHIMIYIGDGKVVESVPRAGVRVAAVRKAGYKALRIKDV